AFTTDSGRGSGRLESPLAGGKTIVGSGRLGTAVTGRARETGRRVSSRPSISRRSRRTIPRAGAGATAGQAPRRSRIGINTSPEPLGENCRRSPERVPVSNLSRRTFGQSRSAILGSRRTRRGLSLAYEGY